MNISEIVSKLQCHYDWRQENENCQYKSWELDETIKAAIDELKKQLPQSIPIVEPIIIEPKIKVVVITGENTSVITDYIKEVDTSNFLLFPEANCSITHCLEQVANRLSNAIDREETLYITTYSRTIFNFIFMLMQLGGIVEKAGENRAKIEAERLDIPYLPICTGEIKLLNIDEEGKPKHQYITGNSFSVPYIIRQPLDKLESQCEEISSILFRIHNSELSNN